MTIWKILDDPEYSLQKIFQNTAFQFNDEHVVIYLSTKTYGMDNINLIDPNDMTRIRIQRDGKFYDSFCVATMFNTIHGSFGSRP